MFCDVDYPCHNSLPPEWFQERQVEVFPPDRLRSLLCSAMVPGAAGGVGETPPFRPSPQGEAHTGSFTVGRVWSGPRLSSCSEETRARCANELADVTCFLGPVENIPISTEPIRMFPRWSAKKPQMSLRGCGWGVRRRGLPGESRGEELPSP